MIEEDIRVSQESDKVSNESDFTRNSRVEEQANIKSNPDETKESFSNINKKVSFNLFSMFYLNINYTRLNKFNIENQRKG